MELLWFLTAAYFSTLVTVGPDLYVVLYILQGLTMCRCVASHVHEACKAGSDVSFAWALCCAEAELELPAGPKVALQSQPLALPLW